MKNFLILSTVMVMISAALVCASPAGATDEAAAKATRDECKAKVEQAANLIKEIGLQPTLKKLMEKNGPFIWKDSYVFCMDDEMGKIMAHPMTRLIGFPMKTWKDADGKQPFVKVLDEINTKSEGWFSYNYQMRGDPAARLKTTYYLKIPGEKAVVAAGYYE